MGDDYARAAASDGIELSLDAAVAEVNSWSKDVDCVGRLAIAAHAAGPR